MHNHDVGKQMKIKTEARQLTLAVSLFIYLFILISFKR